jgi:hypothetical protein
MDLNDVVVGFFFKSNHAHEQTLHALVIETSSQLRSQSRIQHHCNNTVLHASAVCSCKPTIGWPQCGDASSSCKLTFVTLLTKAGPLQAGRSYEHK